MENSKIEWTQHTFSPWHGCAKVSPGCKNCYADAQHSFHYSSLKAQQGTCWGVGSPRLAVSADTWKKPLKWNREAQAAGTRARVFCASMADVFEAQSELSRGFAGQTAQVPSGPGKTRTVTFVDIAAERLKLLRLIYDTPHLDWLLLTKRPEHIVPALEAAFKLIPPADVCSDSDLDFGCWLIEWIDLGNPPANVWLGTSVENQEQADARIPHLLAAPAAVRFLSCEPLLGAVDLMDQFKRQAAPIGVDEHSETWGPSIDWVIVGGESGAKARPMHPDWARSLRDQCQAAGVAFHFKQWGEYGTSFHNIVTGEPIIRQFDNFQQWVNKAGPWMAGAICLDTSGKSLLVGGDFMSARDSNHFPVALLHRVGKHAAGRLLDGRTWDELPSVATSVPA